MTAKSEPIDGGLVIDPAVARVLLAYREAIAQATAKAIRELRAAGLPEAAILAMWRGITDR